MNGHASLNRSFTLVWSDALQTYVVAPETARRRSKRSGASLKPLVQAAVLAVAALGAMPDAQAQVKSATTVVPTGGNANAYISPNGVPVVNINTANAAGISHNQFTRYDVEINGMVLNNGNTSQVARQSQLAGQVMANVNLSNEARVILNEVVSTRRSTLAGFTEVVGGKADVIVANPNGITCTGCGFINTDRVTLTTGTPNMAADGNLNGFTVNRGDILVNGSGFNASAQQVLDLVARSVKVDGQINVPDLGIVTGANVWSYDTRNVTGSATATGTVPGYAIDSTAVGGMYAGRIRLVATEAGVGVRMLGEAAASADDFTLNSAGKVDIRSKLSAQRDLSVTSTMTGGDAVSLTDASLSARRDLALTATSGGATLNGSALVATNDLSLTLGSLSDTASGTVFDDNNKRYAGHALNINVTQAASLDGTSWGTGGALSATMGSLSVGSSGATLYAADTLSLTATTGNLSLATAAVVATNDLSLTATSGAISTAAGAGQGIQSSHGNIALTSATGMTNAGVITADAGNVTARLNGTVTNSGTIFAHATLDMADRSGSTTESVSNSGTLLADGYLSLLASTLTNTGGMQGTTGSLVAASSFNNSGLFVASGTPGHSGIVTAGSLTNSGTIQSAEDLSLAIALSLNNSGKLLADHDLSIANGSASASLSNTSSGVIQATNALSVTGSQTAFSTQAGVLLGHTATLNIASLNNSGTLQSDTTMGLTTSGAVSNSGTVLAKTSLTLAGASLSNSGWLESDTTMGLSLTGALTNTSAGHILAKTTQSLTAGSLSNDGAIQADGAQTVNISGAATNTGTILAQSTQSWISTSLNNSGTLEADAAQTMTVSGAVTNSGTLLANTTQTASLGSLNNSGTWEADDGTGLTVSGAITNSGKLIASATTGHNGSITAATLSNTSTGTIQAAQNLSISLSGATLSNAGKILAANDLSVTSTGSGLTLSNLNGGYLQSGTSSGDTLTLSGNGFVLDNQAGSRLLGDQLLLTLASLTNAGIVQGGTAASTVSVSGTLNNSGTMTLSTSNAGSGTVTADTVTNSGTLQSQGAMALNIATTLTNSGTTLAVGNVTVRGTDGSYAINNTGLMESRAALDLKGQSAGNGVTISVGGSGVLKGATMAMNTSGLTIANGGMVNSTGTMALTLGSLSMGGTTSRIVAGTGSSTIGINNSFTNPGAIYAQGNLTLTANSINNSSTGGIAASGNLTTQATAGDFDNYGALYAGGTLTASSSSTFTNRGTSSAAQGTIDAGGAISISAPTFVNSSTINGSGNITISASTFHNDVAGGDTRHWVTVSDSGDVYDRTDSWYDFPDDYAREYWYHTRRIEQQFTGSAPSFKPQILGGQTVTIQNFNTGTNVGGVISGNTLTLSGNGGGSTFTNNDLSLNYITYRHDWNYYTHWIALGPATYDDHVLNDNAEVQTGAGQVSNIGAGIYANTLNAGGFALTNLGSAYSASVNSRSTSGASGGSMSSSATGTSSTTGSNSLTGGNGVGGRTPTPADNPLVFPGLNLTLPSNPNGFFVVSHNPNAHFLVETNPLFAVGSNFVGSNYLAERYGFNPDTVEKRLGDSNYEAYLVREQLIKQTGNNIIAGQANEADQMKSLMDNAVTQGKQLGLTWGQPLSAAQIGNIKEDMVWMVETTVAGQKVLAPVVYLSAATKASIETGAVISAKDANLNLTSLTNTGGTISGSNSLNITSQGDITNLSGTIKGGDVNLSSTKGSIRNETVATTTGGDKYQNTVIGKTATITATKGLTLDAAKDITVKGGQVAAGGDASLSAGGNVTFDTIENKKANTTSSSSSNGLTSSVTTTTVATTEQIKSGLTTGGNLSIKSKNDITLAGTDVNAGGNANLDAGGSVNLLARANSTKTTSSTTTSGLGVGGGLVGSQTTDTVKGSDRNVGTTLNVGGNAAVTAKKDITLQGATVDVKGDGKLDAGNNVNILAGKDADYSKTTTKTTTFLKVDSGSGESGSSAQSSSGSRSGNGAASAEAGASASANASGKGGLILGESSTSTTTTLDQRSVGSSVKFGGNVDVNAGNTLTLKGSELSAGGDANINAKDVKVLAAENIKTSTTTTSTTSVGFMGESDNKANAQAKASASADSGGAGASGKASKSGVGGTAGADANKLGAQASADASAEASSESKLTLARTSNTSDSSLDITHTGSAIKSGGNMKINASNSLTTVGSSVESGGNMDVKAKDMSFQAAQDVHETRSSSDVTSVGLYADASASAKAQANAKAGGGSMSASGSASAEAKAEGSVGLYGSNEKSSDVKGSTTAVTSSLKAGGNMTRTATNSITDVGTNIEAGGDFTQSAKTITSKAAQNTTYESSKSEKNEAKLGLYAEAGASASASANGSAGIGGAVSGTNTSASADAAAGIKASYENDKSSASSSSSNAVVSTIKAGGKVSSTSSGKTSLEGTQINSGGDTVLNAGSLDYKAAANTSTSTSTDSKGQAELKVDIKLKSSSLGGGYDTSTTKESSSEAVVGGINAGGNLKINTKGDTRLEGTQLSSGGDTSINTGGNLKVDAARNTQTSTTTGFNVAAEISGSKSKSGSSGGIEASGGYNDSSSNASQAVVSNIQSGGKLNVKSGGNASFEGTNIASQGDASIAAKGDLAFNAAKDTASSKSLDVSANIGASKSNEKGGTNAKTGETTKPSSSKEGSFGASADYAQSNSSTATGGTIQSGGNLKLSSGKDTTLEGTQVSAQGKTTVAAGGNVNVKAAESTSTDLSVGGSIGGSTKRETTTGDDGKKTTTKTNEVASADNSFGVAGSKSTTSSVASIGGGQGVDIVAGKDVTLVGTKVDSGGDTKIAAGGNVNLKAATSSTVGGAIGGTAGDGGGVINRAEIGGGNSKEGVSINGAGNLQINSGGRTSMEGTQAKVDGAASINAAGGIDKASAVSGGATLGMTKVGAEVDVAKTSIQAKGGVTEKTGAAAGPQVKAVVQVPINLPAGKKIDIKTADGKPMPTWVKFDPATGAFTGTPPADFKGTLNLVVKVPQADGSVKSVPVKIGQ